jgi:putative Holliday junction resolvase
MSRIIAIDFGLKRTGIAVTDEMKMIASPLETIDTHNLFPFLKDYFSRNNVEKIILGFPKDVDENAQIVIAIKKVFTKLKKEFKDKEIILHDERYTSKISSYLIKSNNLKKKERSDKRLLDRVSACIILQSFLNSYQ